MSQNYIERAASDKTKGFRYQKVRAVQLLLKHMNLSKEQNPLLYVAIENKEDVYFKDGESEMFEDDKLYETGGGFTFNSDVVRNTLVAFVDLWISQSYKPNFIFSFFTTKKIGKEQQNSALPKLLGIELPDKPIIELICGNDIEDETVTIVKKYILSEYKSAYEKDRKESGFIDVLEKWNLARWREFLSKIRWFMGMEDVDGLKEMALKEIVNHKKYSVAEHGGKEEYILHILIDKLDERQVRPHPIDKCMQTHEVDCVFNDLGLGKFLLPEDPFWSRWDSGEEIKDIRNLAEKAESVCNSTTSLFKRKLIRKAAESLHLSKTHDVDKSYLAAKYRVYSNCLEYIEENEAKYTDGRTWSQEDILNEMEAMKLRCINKVYKLKDIYSYSLHSIAEESIDNMIHELFETCHLAFDA
jgi:hypothetical protein